MKLDAYSKVILTVIAVCLMWICVHNSNLVVSAEAQGEVRREIRGYQLGWNPVENVGVVKFRPEGGPAFSQKVASITELAGWAALLNQKPLFQNTKGDIYTGTEPVGDR